MEYKAIQFEIIQMTNPCCWKWVVFLDATKMRTGIALTRADAVLEAEFAIGKAFESRQGSRFEKSWPERRRYAESGVQRGIKKDVGDRCTNAHGLKA